MIAGLRSITDRVLGRGEASITVPSFDGALKPNQILERADVMMNVPLAQDLASDGTTLYVADGSVVKRMDAAGGLVIIRHFNRTLSALAALPDGRLAVAAGGREIVVFDPAGGSDIALTSEDFTSVNALAPGPEGTLIASNGSERQSVEHWAHDLMERGRTGLALSINLETQRINALADGLRYAFGVAQSGEDVLVSESWRHRVIAVSPRGTRRVVCDDLPAYPSRLSPAAGGGFWLTCFTARTQLVEFVLRESGYRRRMMAELDPEFWIAPRLRSGQSFHEPLQGAHVKTMGVMKPWAPPRSYGLVVRLSASGLPIYSLHSRVDGTNHGVVAAVEVGDALYVLAKGPGRLLRVPLARIEKELAA